MGAFGGRKSDEGNHWPYLMEPSCQVLSEGVQYWKNEACKPWSPTGTSLKAYSSHVSEVLVQYDLTYPVVFDEDGSVQFKYRKDSVGTEEDTFGVFKFMIDGEVQHKD